MNIAIIPARGGSKRIKNKNIKIFCGKPMISYSINEAKKTKLFDKIIVSTDSSKIKKISEKFGAEVPFVRPKNLSDDFTPTADVMFHAVKWLKEKKLNPKNICCIYPTAPLMKSYHLINSYRLFKKRKKDFIFAASKFSYPIQRGFYVNEKGSIKMVDCKNYKKRSQDLKEVYHDAGQFYWGSFDGWVKKKKMFDAYSSVYLMPKHRVQDIDNIEDWKFAETLYKASNDKF